MSIVKKLQEKKRKKSHILRKLITKQMPKDLKLKGNFIQQRLTS